MVNWPGMSKDVESYIGGCAVRQNFQDNQQKEAMISHDLPSRPWQ